MTALATLDALATHPGPYGGGFHWWFLFFPLAVIAFWVFLGVLLRALFFRRWGGPWGPRGAHPGHYAGWNRGPSAEQTLAARFAAGDIDEQDYRARLEVLRTTPPDPR